MNKMKVTFLMLNQKLRQDAKPRAKELALSVSQYESVLREGCLRIKSKLYPDRVYTVWVNPHTLIPVTQNGKEVERLCVKMAEEGYPKWDIFLAKVLLLKTDEHQFLRTANHICK